MMKWGGCVCVRKMNDLIGAMMILTMGKGLRVFLAFR
jgi:hypothetical protein